MTKSEFFAAVKRLNLPQNEYVVIGSGILCALGIRDTADVDLIVSETLFQTIENTGTWQKDTFEDGSYYLIKDGFEIGREWDSDDLEPNLADLKKDEIIIDDVPFISLERLKSWKQKRGHDIDLLDIRLIENYFKNSQHPAL